MSKAAISNQTALKLRELIREHGLEQFSDLIIANAADSYAMVIAGNDDYKQVGNTRFGGDPDLPQDFPWPCDGDPSNEESRFSNFIAQVNFGEFPDLPGGSPLPKNGILYVFVRSMFGVSEPVILDNYFYEGQTRSLRRAATPPEERLLDEYLVDLQPQRITPVPSFSLALFRKSFRVPIEDRGDDSITRLLELDQASKPQEAIGQMLGFASAGDLRENLYRQVCLARLGVREMTYSDHWDTMEEYESYVAGYRQRGDSQLVSRYERMRDNVIWLTKNSTEIYRGADAWRLLLRIDSNTSMNMWINDADPLHIFVKDEQLKNCDFSDLAGEVTQG